MAAFAERARAWLIFHIPKTTSYSATFSECSLLSIFGLLVFTHTHIDIHSSHITINPTKVMMVQIGSNMDVVWRAPCTIRCWTSPRSSLELQRKWFSLHACSSYVSGVWLCQVYGKTGTMHFACTVSTVVESDIVVYLLRLQSNFTVDTKAYQYKYCQEKPQGWMKWKPLWVGIHGFGLVCPFLKSLQTS